MHAEALSALYWMMKFVGLDRQCRYAVLNVGGRLVNDPIDQLLPNATWTVVDVKAAPDVTVVADAATWQPDRPYDVVTCTEVFEHTASWREIVATCAAALTCDGHLFVTCASDGRPPHGSEGTEVVPPGEHYANVDVSELRDELRQHFINVCVVYRFPPGDAYAWAHGRCSMLDRAG